MTKRGQIYRCAACGNVVEILAAGVGQLVCCGQKMTLQEENTQEASLEKHIPIVERRENRLVVRVGSTLHPMDAAHYIEWIELSTPQKTSRVYLNPGDLPEAEFETNFGLPDGNFTVRAYCNLHGLWKNEALE